MDVNGCTTRELLRSGKDVAVTIFSVCFPSIEYTVIESVPGYEIGWIHT